MEINGVNIHKMDRYNARFSNILIVEKAQNHDRISPAPFNGYGLP